jgi:molybdopterin converting factor small subunit
MNYVTTNIRISEEDYLRLKTEAAQNRKSLSAIIREKIGGEEKEYSKIKVESLLQELDEVAQENSKYLKGWNSSRALREIRDNN